MYDEIVEKYGLHLLSSDALSTHNNVVTTYIPTSSKSLYQHNVTQLEVHPVLGKLLGIKRLYTNDAVTAKKSMCEHRNKVNKSSSGES